ncbi:MAG: hypothetical protein ACKOX6_05185, partial [Bdellovibrio sp.]
MRSCKRKITVWTLFSLSLSLCACSMDVNVSAIIDGNPSDLINAQRTDVDFTSSEIVTTGNGVVFSGSFGEISEKKVLSNGVTFDGVFYE